MATAKKKAVATAKKKAVNGAAKGADFERLMARELSLWISAGKSDDLLWRSGGSGARSTSRFKKKGGKHLDYQSADIALVHPEAKPFADRFVTECKFYRQLDLHRMFHGARASLIGAWWSKVSREAANVHKEPLLIVKGNGLAPLIFSTASRMQSTGLSNDVREARVIIGALDAGCVELSVLINTNTFEQFAEQAIVPRKGKQRARLLLPVPHTPDK